MLETEYPKEYAIRFSNRTWVVPENIMELIEGGVVFPADFVCDVLERDPTGDCRQNQIIIHLGGSGPVSCHWKEGKEEFLKRLTNIIQTKTI